MNLKRLNTDDPKWLGLLLITPTMLIVLGFLFFPFFYSLVLSFMNYDLARPATMGFIGLRNYLKLFQDKYFLNSFKVTTIFSLVSVVFELILGVGIALVLDQKFKGQGLMRGLIILPWALPSIVNAAMWMWIYNADFGALNALLHQLGIIDEYQIWLADPFKAMALVILANVWKETPFTVVMVLATLQGIPLELYEAAKVDGATAWRSLTHITLPLLKPMIMICGLLQIIWSFQTFELIYIVTRGGPYRTTDIMPMRIYWQTFKSLRFGYGAAMAYLTALILLIPSFFYIRSAYRSVVEY